METLRILPMELGRALPAAPAGEALPGGAPGAAGGAAQAPFQDLLKQAVETANQLSIKSDSLNQALVEGRNVDLHRVVLAQQEAQIAFDLVQQMRDKIVAAYQEVMRMPM